MLRRLTPWRLAALCVSLFCLVVGAAVGIRATAAGPERPIATPSTASVTPAQETGSASSPGVTPTATREAIVSFMPVPQHGSTLARGCGVLYLVPYSISDLRKIVAGEDPNGDVLGDTRAVVVNDGLDLQMSAGGARQVSLTGITVKVVRSQPYTESGTYVVDETGCDAGQQGNTAFDWTDVDAATGSVSTLHARFAGQRVMTSNQSAFTVGNAASNLRIQPYGCGKEVAEWTARVGWTADGHAGSSLLGPFRTTPDQELPEYALSQKEQGVSPLQLTPLSSQHSVRTCQAAPLPDPAHPTAYPHCGTVNASRNHSTIYVLIRSGTVRCAEARRIVDTYLNDPSYTPQGSGGLETIGTWQCGSVTVAETLLDGYAGNCSSATGDIEMAQK